MPSTSQRKPPLSAALGVLVPVLLLLLGLWLGGHPEDLPGFVRKAFVAEARSAVVQEAIERVADDYYRPISRNELDNTSISGLVAGLHDRFSHYLTPSEFHEFNAPPHFAGIGVVVNPEKQGLLVVRVFDSSPASRAGLKDGELIVGVDGHKLAGLSAEASTALIKGKPGTDVHLQLESGGKGHRAGRKVTITRALVSEPVVASESRTVKGVKLGIVALATFSLGAHAEVREAVERELHAGARGILFDLRGNGGGLVEEAQLIASIFIPKGVIVSTRGRTQPSQTLDALGDAIPSSIPMVVLVDADTASAAEIVTAALQDHGRATIVGTHTFGKGVFQEEMPLSNGGALDITVGEYFTPNGRNLGGGGVKQGAGITPEVKLSKSVVDTQKGLEEALDRLAAKVR
jgi:carboxyl-terminal processing protease